MHHYFLGWAKLRFSLGILKGQSLFINLIQIHHMSTPDQVFWILLCIMDSLTSHRHTGMSSIVVLPTTTTNDD